MWFLLLFCLLFAGASRGALDSSKFLNTMASGSSLTKSQRAWTYPASRP